MLTFDEQVFLGSVKRWLDSMGRRGILSTQQDSEFVKGRLGRTPSLLARCLPTPSEDRKSTRLNSSHANISYAVFCLKKKKDYCLSSTLCLVVYSLVFRLLRLIGIRILTLMVLDHIQPFFLTLLFNESSERIITLLRI